VREDAQDVDPALDHQQRADLDNRRLSLLGGFDGPLRLRLRGDGDGRDVEDRGHVLGAAAVDEPRGDVDGAEVAPRVGDAEGAVEVRERGAVGVAHRRRLLEGEGHGAVGRGEGGQAHAGHGDVGRPRAEQQEQRSAGAARRQQQERRRGQAGRQRGGAGRRRAPRRRERERGTAEALGGVVVAVHAWVWRRPRRRRRRQPAAAAAAAAGAGDGRVRWRCFVAVRAARWRGRRHEEGAAPIRWWWAVVVPRRRRRPRWWWLLPGKFPGAGGLAAAACGQVMHVCGKLSYRVVGRIGWKASIADEQEMDIYEYDGGWHSGLELMLASEKSEWLTQSVTLLACSSTLSVSLNLFPPSKKKKIKEKD
jgi:hypothetical protein